jgi:hypothetical protein
MHPGWTRADKVDGLILDVPSGDNIQVVAVAEGVHQRPILLKLASGV